MRPDATLAVEAALALVGEGALERLAQRRGARPPAARYAAFDRVEKPGMSRGSHSGSDRGPAQCATSWAVEPVVVGFDEVAGVPGHLARELRAGRRAGCVSPIAFATPCQPLRAAVHDEVGEVVDVDDLGAEALEHGREHGLVAGEREPPDPVPEAVGGVARARRSGRGA